MTATIGGSIPAGRKKRLRRVGVFFLFLCGLLLTVRVLLQRSVKMESSGGRLYSSEDGDDHKMWYDGLPVYYINLPKSVDRDHEMRRVFGGAAVRVEALDGNKLNDLAPHFDGRMNEKQSGVAVTAGIGPAGNLTAQYLFDRYMCVPGQLGNFLSHLKAMRIVHNEGHEHALIVEDDLNPVYVGVWPIKTLLPLIEEADEYHPTWNAIRVQWHDYPKHVEVVHKAWLRESASATNDSVADASRVVKFLRPYKGGWGNMATIWSRRGIEKFMEMYTSDDGRFMCLNDRPCVADLSFWNNPDIFVTVPPLLGPRALGLSTDEIRRGVVENDHSTMHRKAAAAQLLWLIEAKESRYAPPAALSRSFNDLWAT